MKNNDQKRKSLRHRVFDYLFYAIFGVLTLALTWVAISMIRGEQPNFFNYHFYQLKTDSMEPTLPTGCIILAHNDESYEGLSLGTVITFRFSNETTIPNTHRIVGYYFEDSNGTKDSTFLYSTYEDFYSVYDYSEYKIIGYRTEGDNPNYGVDSNPVLFEDIQSRCVGRVMFVQYIYNFLMTPYGYILLILIPALCILVVQIYNVVAKKKKKSIDAQIEAEKAKKDALIKEIEAKAIEEYKKTHPKE